MHGRNSTALGVRLNDKVIEEIKRRAEPEELTVGLWIKKLVEDAVQWDPPTVEESG
jgi:hypothetical protein